MDALGALFVLMLVVVLIVVVVRRSGVIWEDAKSTGYPGLELLRIFYVLCAIAALITSIVGIATGPGYIVVVAALSALFFMGAAGAIRLATDVARYTRQIAGDLRALRVMAQGPLDGKAPADQTYGKTTGEQSSGITGYRKD